MQPPLAGSASTMPRCRASAGSIGKVLARISARGEARVGEVQPVDEDADEGAVELAAACDARALQVGDADAQDARWHCRAHRRAALLAAEREVRHLAEALAGTEHGEELLVLRHAHLAVDEDAEEIARIAL